MVIEKTKEKLIYTEKGYETLNIINIRINDIEYKDYYIKGELTDNNEKYIIDNLAYITFIKNKFIGEIRNKKIEENKYIEEQLFEKQEKDKRVLEIYKNSKSLRAQAFLEVYFSTNYVPNTVKYAYVVKNDLKDYDNLDIKIKKEFQGKVMEFNKKIKEVEEKRHQIYLNLEEMRNNSNEDLVQILIKIENYLLNLKNQNGLKEKLKKINLFQKRKENILKKSTDFDKEKSQQELEQHLNSEINYKSLKELQLKLEKKVIENQNKLEYLENQNKSILLSETKVFSNIDEYLDSLSFDNFYEYVEKGDYIIDREEFAKKV